MNKKWVAILDFGSQYTHLIARRVRECGVYSEIISYDTNVHKLSGNIPTCIILSGGPASVTGKDSPVCDKDIFNIGVPVLGICYGAQLMAKMLGSKVLAAKARKYGKAVLNVKSRETLFRNLSLKEPVWMSHGDKITQLPQGFRIIGATDNSHIAAMKDAKSGWQDTVLNDVATVRGLRDFKRQKEK